MKRTNLSLFILIFVLPGALVCTSGCSKKRVASPVLAHTAHATTSPAPAPTLTLSVSPPAINQGEATTISWSAQNSTTVKIDGGLGSVVLSGSRSISPRSSTTYTGVAVGPGGTATASARVTVVKVELPIASPTRTVSDSEFFSGRISDVFFDYDSYDLRPDARYTLDRNHAALSERPSIHVTVEGHCDERGSERYNLALGDKRAQAVKQYLVSKAIPAIRIETLSYGEERPVDRGHNEAAWAKNRRAHFVMKHPEP